MDNKNSLIQIMPTEIQNVAPPEEVSVSRELLNRRQNGYSQRENNNKNPFDRKKKNPLPGDRNAQRKGGNKPRNNFFTQQLERMGPDFIEKMQPRDFSNNLERIVREIVKGRCDINTVGTYIANPIMLRQLIVFCSEQFNRNEIIRNALDVSARVASQEGYIVSMDHTRLLEEHKSKAAMYYICMQRFMELQNTGDPNVLIALVNETYRYAHLL